MKPAEHLAEALFQLRSLSGLGKLCLKPSARPYLEDAEREVVTALAALGYDAGTTAADADALKLQLMGRAVPDGYGGDAGPAEGRLELALQELADRFGDGNVFRQLERFTHFCSQMRFAFVPDDKLMPVHPWCRAEGRQPAGDLAEAVQLYEQWLDTVMVAQFRVDLRDHYQAASSSAGSSPPPSSTATSSPAAPAPEEAAGSGSSPSSSS